MVEGQVTTQGSSTDTENPLHLERLHQMVEQVPRGFELLVANEGGMEVVLMIPSDS